jgi:membrane associated rhomboid family serine protease
MFPLRDSQPSYTRPVVTIAIIVVNILIFLFEFSMDEPTRNAFITLYGLVPDSFRVINIFTSMFLHGGWLHVLGNMWFLWVFGDNIEDILGHGKYLLFYLVCGVAAAMSQVLISPDSQVPMVGASGAIAGVMGAYMIKFPRARIESILILVFFITRFDVPAWLMLIYWFGTQLFSGVGSIGYTQASQGGTAFFAHIGGFIAGMALIKIMGAKERVLRRSDAYWR